MGAVVAAKMEKVCAAAAAMEQDGVTSHPRIAACAQVPGIPLEPLPCAISQAVAAAGMEIGCAAAAATDLGGVTGRPRTAMCAQGLGIPMPQRRHAKRVSQPVSRG